MAGAAVTLGLLLRWRRPKTLGLELLGLLDGELVVAVVGEDLGTGELALLSPWSAGLRGEESWVSLLSCAKEKRQSIVCRKLLMLYDGIVC